MEKYVYIGGIPGVGKTTTISKLSSEFGCLKHISAGDYKGPESKKKFGVSLSGLNQEQTTFINSWFFENIFNNYKGKTFLIDSHYTYPTGENFVNLIPEKYAPNFDLFILLEASASIVLDRRINRGRDKDSITLSFLEKELSVEKIEAKRLAKKYNIPLEKISTENDFFESLNKFREIFRNYNLL